MQNQELGRDSDNMCAEGATKNTPNNPNIFFGQSTQ